MSIKYYRVSFHFLIKYFSLHQTPHLNPDHPDLEIMIHPLEHHLKEWQKNLMTFLKKRANQGYLIKTIKQLSFVNYHSLSIPIPPINASSKVPIN